MNKTVEDLQKEKLELEIAEIGRKWYKKKDYLQILLPATIAFASLLYAIVTGFFSTKYEQYLLQKEQLKLEVLYFEKVKNDLNINNAALSSTNDSLSSVLVVERRKMADLNSELLGKEVLIHKKELLLRKKEEELFELASRRDLVSTQISVLQDTYNKKKASLEKELEKQYIAESDLQERLKKKDETIQFLNRDIKLLTFQTDVVNRNPFIRKSKEFDFKLWNLEQVRKYLEQDLNENSKRRALIDVEIEKSRKSIDSLNAKDRVRKVN